MTSTLLPIIPAVDDILFNFAQSDDFWANLATAFGTSYDVVKATELRNQWQSRNFSQLPPIEVLSGEVLGTAKGAYAVSTNKIYLSESFLNVASSESLVKVILEEIGHYVDAQINPVDSAGDEGAIFAELVQGNSLDVATLEALREENDQTTIIVNGEIIQVEQANFTGTNGNDNITGTSGDDNIYGLDGNDTLSGLGGNDKLYGGNGNDSLDGGAGNDVIYSDAGNDTINGGSGFDYYNADYSNRSTGLTMTYDPTTGNGTITVGTEVDTLISIESFNYPGGFIGTNFADVIVGTADNENFYGISGRDGNDTISGGAGNDELYGEEGNDVLNGDAGNDSLYGGNNNDTLQGTNSGTGEYDYLEGGTGSDRFILADTTKTFYDDGNATNAGTNDYARIADFNTTDDIIQLRGSSSDYLLSVSGSNTNLYINKPGSEPDELIAVINNQTALSLTASYFSYVSSPTLPTITLAVSPSSVTEDGTTNLVYTFTRSGVTTNALTVNYTVGGTATNGTDYASIPTSVIFAANSATATLIVDPTADTTVESNETVILTLATGTGYTVGTTTAVTGTITNDDTSVTPIEAFGNTKLVQDTTNKLYTQIGNNNPIAINISGTQITTNIYPGWQTLASETVNGVNQVLWKYNDGNYLHLWSLDSNWNWQSSTGWWGLNSSEAFTQETNFQQDFNGDGIIGSPYTTIETFGNTKLVQDTTNKLYTQIGNNNPIAINISGTQITTNIYPGWQTLAAETVNGVNQVLWKYNDGNYLHLWSLDNNWNWQSSTGWWGLNSSEAFTQETNFQQDFNGDGIIGSPYTTIEAFGNTKLVQDTTNKLYTQIGNNNPTAINISGTQITTNIYPGWQTLAAETVNGVNQVLWKYNDGNYLHLWSLDSNWNWQSSTGWWGLNSSEAFTQETNFQQDFNGDGVIGQPYTPIEAFGNTKLVKDTTNKLYTQIGNNNPIAINISGTQITTNIYPGWQTLASETVNGVNQVLWKYNDGNYLHLWSLDSNWNWQSSTGWWGLNSSEAFTQETNFQQDFNGDGIIGQPYTTIEAFSNTKLVQDATNKLYTQIGNNNPTAIKIGATQITTNIYPGWQTLAAETVNGVNQVLWKYNDGNYLHLWSLDSNWNWQSSTGWWGLNSSEAFTQETNFQQDFNGDGVIGQPYTPIEAFGNTKLVQDTTNKLYTQIGNNNPIAIKIGATQITTNIYPGWQTLASETVNGVNQVLWKYNDGNYLHLWSLDSNWNWQSSTGWWGLNSSEAFTQETNFQQDFNGDGIIGQPYTTIETFGNTKLVKDTTNKLYAQIGNNNPTAINISGTQITTNIYSGWQTLAAETVNGVNQVLWKYNDGNYLHLWSLDSNWNWQSSTGWWGLNSSEAFTQETNFQQDFNGDNQIGNPLPNIASSLAVSANVPEAIIGSSNDDILTGTLDNDILIGGLGNDTITGGAGGDNFTFNNLNEGIDTITDFLFSQGDKIAVSAAGFGGGLAAGVPLTSAQFLLGTTALNASNRFIYNTITGGLFFDGDGTGTLAAIQIATLSSKPTISDSDILVLV
jgi:hypothetical protein